MDEHLNTDVNEEDFYTAAELLKAAGKTVIFEIEIEGMRKKFEMRKPKFSETMAIERGSRGNNELATLKTLSMCLVKPRLSEAELSQLDTGIITQLGLKLGELTAGSKEMQDRLKNLLSQALDNQ